MHPILFEFGAFKIHTFGVMLVLAFLAGLTLARTRAARYGIDASKLADAAVWLLVWGVLGARVFYILQNLPQYLGNPRELFSLQFQGLTSFGGVIFGAIYLYWWAKRNRYAVPAVMDAVAPAMMLGHVIGRIGCYLNGCCYGGQCPPTMPLALHIQGIEYTVHPAQLYDAAMNLIGLGILLWREGRGLLVGQTTGFFLMLHGTARFIYEYWRAGETAERVAGFQITEAQVVSALMFALGFAIYLIYGRAKAGAEQEVGLA